MKNTGVVELEESIETKNYLKFEVCSPAFEVPLPEVLPFETDVVIGALYLPKNAVNVRFRLVYDLAD